jgi:hypothetical protein
MIFFPHLSLAFEYQGEHHYISNYFGSSSVRQRRDQAKVKFASQLGITLISIPFWWDRTSDSLASTIEYYRPDIHLQAKKALPISMEMPDKFGDGAKFDRQTDCLKQSHHRRPLNKN